MLLCFHTQTTETLGPKSVFRCELTITLQTMNIVSAGKSPTHMAAAFVDNVANACSFSFTLKKKKKVVSRPGGSV